jgi:threonine aldolase
LRNAAHANAAAKKLAQRIERETNLRLVLPVQSNSIFVRLSDAASSSLTARGWNFYKFIEPDVYRLMCSWATVDDDMDVFVREIKSVLATS